ncbi:uncharacterized protein LOC126416052 [Schistocerca serialis cubense]|uniref:uncharacterized protein LOC126416052 n=1 Tax=Schistocerca serialis cubense TaxID=2023355 RepID=UPI00214EE1A1|nr:uncharacterized protein LOC126416052 [Schistocerca serialis cubense]
MAHGEMREIPWTLAHQGIIICGRELNSSPPPAMEHEALTMPGIRTCKMPEKSSNKHRLKNPIQKPTGNLPTSGHESLNNELCVSIQPMFSNSPRGPTLPYAYTL